MYTVTDPKTGKVTTFVTLAKAYAYGKQVGATPVCVQRTRP